MRILYVSQHYPPDLGALATRARDLSRRWAAAGHEVHLLCGLPNHPTGVVPPEYQGRLHVHEVIDGVHVHRLWVYPTANRGVLRRGIGYLSLAASTLTLGQAIPQPDVVVSTSPQFLAGLAGTLWGLFRRVPVVVEIRDLWPRSIWELDAMRRDHPTVRAMEVAERWLYRVADTVVVVTEPFQDHVAAIDPSRPRSRIPVITNGVDLSRFDPETDPEPLRAELGLGRAPIAMYTGTHGMAHGLEVVVDAARLAPEVQWVLVGEGATRQALQAYGAGVPNVRFCPAVPSHRMPEVYALADVCLAPLRDLDVFRTVIPSKLFEIWAMERPVVLGVRGEAERVVRASGGGVVVPPEDPVALADAVRALAADPDRRRSLGRAGHAYTRAHYDRDTLAQRFLAVIEEAAHR